MAENEGGAANPNKSSGCEECGLNPAKYKCPGCQIRSCSLPCVKSHKQRTNCTGKRSRTHFIPLSQFDDNLLLSDYNLLEETKRFAESAKRMRGGFGENFDYKIPSKLKLFRNAAGRRKTRVLLLPSGMSMREKNQSWFNQRKKTIFWTIEWRFHSTDVVLMDHGVEEHSSLYAVIEGNLKPGTQNQQLRPFCKEQLNHLKFFIRKNPKGPKSLFRELDIKAPISQELADIVVLEYPIIHVYLPSHSYEFEIEKHAKSFSQGTELAESVNDVPSPEGIPFREEEIEEDGTTLDTQVRDFMQYANPEPMDNYRIPEGILLQNRRAEEEDMQFSTRNTDATKPISNNGMRECTAENPNWYFASDDVEFEFEQDLRDAYTGLIKDTNPDDFLCLEGGFCEEEELEGRTGDNLALMGEELEEGEIPGF